MKITIQVILICSIMSSFNGNTEAMNRRRMSTSSYMDYYSKRTGNGHNTRATIMAVGRQDVTPSTDENTVDFATNNETGATDQVVDDGFSTDFRSEATTEITPQTADVDEETTETGIALGTRTSGPNGVSPRIEFTRRGHYGDSHQYPTRRTPYSFRSRSDTTGSGFATENGRPTTNFRSGDVDVAAENITSIANQTTRFVGQGLSTTRDNENFQTTGIDSLLTTKSDQDVNGFQTNGIVGEDVESRLANLSATARRVADGNVSTEERSSDPSNGQSAEERSRSVTRGKLPAIYRPDDNKWRWTSPRTYPPTRRTVTPSTFGNGFHRPTGYGSDRPGPGFDQPPRPFQSNGASSRPVDSSYEGPVRKETKSVAFGLSRNMTRAVSVNADCLNSNMKISIRLNGSFTGLIYSSGYVHDPECVYINGTGAGFYEFYIRLNRCGTLGRSSDVVPQKTGKGNGFQARNNNYRWNTITVQYDSMIEEEWDQHFKVTCEMGEEYWKTVTFPVLDVNIATGNPLLFTTTPPECYMEIKRGFGLTGPKISGAVTVGDPLTLIIHMRSSTDGFDISVNNCYAHNGANKRLLLVDKEGCPTQDKLISAFKGEVTQDSVHQTSLSAFFKAFRFTGSPALYIECDVHMCKGSCPNQRCNWRDGEDLSRQRRSPANGLEENRDVSEKVNLFQSLEVRQDREEETRQPISFTGTQFDENTVCMANFAFITMISVLASVLLLSTIISMCMCVRFRNIKNHSSIMKNSVPHAGFMRSPMSRLS